MEGANPSHVSASLARVFVPERGRRDVYSRSTLVTLKCYFDILLDVICLGGDSIADARGKSSAHTALSWTRFIKSFCVNKGSTLFYFNIIQYACNIHMVFFIGLLHNSHVFLSQNF